MARCTAQFEIEPPEMGPGEAPNAQLRDSVPEIQRVGIVPVDRLNANRTDAQGKWPCLTGQILLEVDDVHVAPHSHKFHGSGTGSEREARELSEQAPIPKDGCNIIVKSYILVQTRTRP